MRPKKIITAILLFILIARLQNLTPSPKDLFRKNYHYENLEALYQSSQYVQENPQGWIPDNAVYNYAAGYYLRGGSPITIDPSQPPLGKYLLAISIFFFQNTTVAVYLFFYLNLLVFFLLAQKIFQNRNLSLLAVLLLLFEKNFLSQLRYTPTLDIFQLFFIILSFYFFLQWLDKKRPSNLILACLSLGGVAATKFFITALLIFITWLVFLIIKRKWSQLVSFLFWALLCVSLVLCLSYFRVLLDEPDPYQIINIQKWLYRYHSNKLTSLFTIWPLIYFNRWYTWWGERKILSDPQWWFGWPVLFTASFLFLIFSLFKKIKDSPIELILTWFVVYSLFLSFAQANSRYLIPILPFLYLILIKGLILLKNEIQKKI